MQLKKVGILGLWIVLFTFIFFFLYKIGFDFASILNGTKSLGVMGILVFLCCYIISPVFFIPITPLSITAGMLFGPYLGFEVSLIGATLGATLAFIISRYLLKDWVDNKSHSRIELVQEKIKQLGWKFVVIARISPIFPFSAQNYIFGVTNIPIKEYFISTLFSLIPGTFTYVYIGYAGKSAYAGTSGFEYKVTVAILFLATLTLAPYFLNKLKNSKKVSN